MEAPDSSEALGFTHTWPILLSVSYIDESAKYLKGHITLTLRSTWMEDPLIGRF